MKGKVYFVFSSLALERGGLTRALMARANMLSDNSYIVVFLTYHYQKNFHRIIADLKRGGYLRSEVVVLNFYDEILNLSSAVGVKSILKSKYCMALKKILKPGSFIIRKNKITERKGGVDKVYSFNKKGLLERCKESRNESVSFKHYDRAGSLRHCIFQEGSEKVEEVFFNKKGEKTLSTKFESGKSSRTMLFFEAGETFSFKSLRAAQLNWIESQLREEHCFLFADSRYVDDFVYKANCPKAKKVAVLHNNHNAFPFGSDAPIKKMYARLLDHADKYDLMVTLTERQYADLIDLGLPANKLRKIPHFTNVERGGYVKKENNLVMLARYDYQKKIEDAVAIMDLVVKKIPNASLDIFGMGAEESKLNDLIRANGLEHNVFLRGYTRDGNKWLEQASCSLLTSLYEGFALVVMESLAVGTPVVSFDINYGPSEMIKDGENGYIIPERCVEFAADKVIDVLTNGVSMDSKNISEDILHRYGERSYVQAWLEILEGSQA